MPKGPNSGTRIAPMKTHPGRLARKAVMPNTTKSLRQLMQIDRMNNCLKSMPDAQKYKCDPRYIPPAPKHHWGSVRRKRA